MTLGKAAATGVVVVGTTFVACAAFAVVRMAGVETGASVAGVTFCVGDTIAGEVEVTASQRSA